MVASHTPARSLTAVGCCSLRGHYRYGKVHVCSTIFLVILRLTYTLASFVTRALWSPSPHAGPGQSPGNRRHRNPPLAGTGAGDCMSAPPSCLATVDPHEHGAVWPRSKQREVPRRLGYQHSRYHAKLPAASQYCQHVPARYGEGLHYQDPRFDFKGAVLQARDTAGRGLVV